MSATHDRRIFLRTLSALPIASTATVAGEIADPAFAAIRHHRRLHAVIEAVPIDDEGPEYQAACDAEEAALQALARLAPTTVAGAAASLEYILDREAVFTDEQATGSPVAVMIRTVVIALRTMKA